MKKALVAILGAVFAMAIYWLGFANGVYCTESTIEERIEVSIPTDEELMNQTVESLFGDGYYGVLVASDDPREIAFTVYKADGTSDGLCKIPRYAYQEQFTNVTIE